MNIEMIGLLAGCCTTGAFAPQAVKILKTRRVDDISLAMYLSFVFGVALWVVYGLSIHSIPVVVSNSITLMLSGSILTMKIALGRSPTP